MRRVHRTVECGVCAPFRCPVRLVAGGGAGRTAIRRNTMGTPIRRGNLLRIRPEWRDEGDEDFVWIALEDEDGGRVPIAPLMDLSIPPRQVVTTDMIEKID